MNEQEAIVAEPEVGIIVEAQPVWQEQRVDGGKLILHRDKGARIVSREELAQFRAPAPVGRWCPVNHISVVERAIEALKIGGYDVVNEKLSITRNGERFFGLLSTNHQLANGVSMAIGLRGSYDKVFPIGFAGGMNVFVCDNLALRGELMCKRKNTTNGLRNWNIDIVSVVTNLREYAAIESRRIEAMKVAAISDQTAESTILRACETGIINTQELLPILGQWRVPRFDDFRERTAWSLHNAFTEILRDKFTKNPHSATVATAALSAMLFGDEKSTILAI